MDLVVNATPAGMAGSAAATVPVPVAPEHLHAGQVVVDLVYHPRRTAWMAAAAGRGAEVVGGLGMLVHQAAAQLAWWTATDPPLEAMWAALDTELGGVER
jgi:shikimate dehydrogenase